MKLTEDDFVQTATAPQDHIVVEPKAVNTGAPNEDDFASTLTQINTEDARSINTSNMMTNPDQAAEAAKISSKISLPSAVVEQELDHYRAQARTQENNKVLESTPELANYVAEKPDIAKQALDDFHNMGAIAKLAKAAKTGASQALVQDELNRINFEQLWGTKPQYSAKETELRKALSTPDGIDGTLYDIVKNVSSLATGISDQLNQPSSLANITAGGAAGSIVPGLGTAGGLGAGTVMSMFQQGFEQGTGQIYGSLKNTLDIHGNPIDPTIARSASLAGGMLLGGLNMLNIKALNAPMARAIADWAPKLTEKLAANPTVMGALTRFTARMAGSSLEGATLMGASALVDAVVPDIAKTIDKGEHATLFNDEASMNKFVNDVVASMETGATTFGAVHLIPHAMSMASNIVRLSDANNKQNILTSLEDQSSTSKLRERNPDAFNEYVGTQLKDSHSEFLYVPAENVKALYESTATTPGEKDTIFGFVPDMQQQMENARVSGGDIVIPTSDYLTHLAGTPTGEQLRPFIRTEPGGASLLDIEDFNKNIDTHAENAASTLGNAQINSTGNFLKDLIDNQISAVRDENGSTPLFKTPEESGMTPEQFDNYKNLVAKSQEDARKVMFEKAVADITKKRKTSWYKQRHAERDQAIKSVETRQDYSAHNIITSNVRPEGQEGIPQMKLDRQDLVRRFGEGILDQFPQSNFGPKGVAKKGGMELDLAAEMLGYDSGDKLIRDLTGLEADRRMFNEGKTSKTSLKDILVDRETDQRMVDKHGGILDDGSIRDQALDAVHNASQLEVLKAEAEQLSEQKGIFSTDLHVEKQWAKDQIGQQKVREGTKPYKYLQDEQKAARNTERALMEGRKGDAIVYKKQQLMNHLLYNESRVAQKQYDSLVKTSERLASKETIKSMDQDYLNQIHKVLSVLGFKLKRSLSELIDVAGNVHLKDFIADKIQDGRSIVLPDFIENIQAYANGIEGMNVDTMRQLKAMIDSMAENGRLEKTIFSEGIRMEKEHVVKDITDTVYKNKEKRELSHWLSDEDKDLTTSALDRLTAIQRSIGSELTKQEQLFQSAQGRKFLGPFDKFIFRPLKDAQHKANDMAKTMADHINSLKMSKEWNRSLSDKVDNKLLLNPEDGKPAIVTRKRMIAIALNTGNKGNFERLVNGHGWKQEDVSTFLNNNMKKEDWNFVQHIWDAFGKLWPDIRDMERRLSGVAADKVEPNPLVTPHGKYEGGYYPVVYDRLKSDRAARAEQRSKLYDSDYYRATTPKGHTVNRIEGYTDRLSLDLDIIPWKLRSAIHDISFREAVVNADKILSDPRVKKAFGDTWGPEYYAQFRPWLKDIANAPNVDARPLETLDKIMSHSRTAAVEMGIGFRLTTALKHGLSALSNSVGELGGKWMLNGVNEYARSPIEVRDKVFSLSGEMRHRANALDRDLRSTISPVLGETGAYAKWRYYSHALVARLDMESAIPTWLGAYNKALVEGRNGRDAVYFADQTVRNAHGAQGIVDMAAIQRGPEWKKMFTTFYGFFNHMFNRMVDTKQIAERGVKSLKSGDYESARHDAVAVMVRTMTYLVIPAFVEAAIARHGKEEDESYLGYAAKVVAGQAAATVPVLRNLAHALKYSDPGEIPVYDMLNKFAQQFKDVKRLHEGDASDKWIKHAVQTAGYIVPLPGAGQASQSIQFLWDAYEGNEIPRDALDWTKGLIYGKIDK